LVFDAFESASRNTGGVLGSVGIEQGRMAGASGHLFWEPGNMAEDVGRGPLLHRDSAEALGGAGGKPGKASERFGHVFTERRGLFEVLVRVFGEPGSLPDDFGHLLGKPG
jgi:hypothetical protein